MLSEKYIGRTEEADKMNMWLETNHQGKETELLKLAFLGKPMSGKPAPLAYMYLQTVEFSTSVVTHLIAH